MTILLKRTEQTKHGRIFEGVDDDYDGYYGFWILDGF
jgi:hypothetical protein